MPKWRNFLIVGCCTETLPLPSFSVDFLRQQVYRDGEVSPKVSEAASFYGAFVITDLGEIKNNPVINPDTVAECFRSHPVGGVVTKAIAPGVLRTTSATASISSSSHPDCVKEAADNLDSVMDKAGAIVTDLIGRLAGGKPELVRRGRDDHAEAADLEHLNHLHLYEIHGDHIGDHVVPFHTDSGLFLLLTASEAEPLLVKTSSGMIAQAEDNLKPDSLIVLFGRALTEWMKIGGIHAPQHAVLNSNRNGGSEVRLRSVYARMYVAPEDAYVQTSKQSFGEFFAGKRDGINGYKSPQLCSADFGTGQSNHSPSRKLFSDATKSMCEEGFAFCWMNCLPFSDDCESEAQVCFEDINGMPCCTEDQTPDQDGCLDMNFDCAWHCPSMGGRPIFLQ